MRRAIVIGASSGMGMGIAKRLLQENFKVAALARRVQNLEELKSINPNEVIIERMDVQHYQSHAETLQKLVEALGGLDLLIVCAGIGHVNEELNVEKELDTVATNVTGFTGLVDWGFNYF